MSMGTDWRPDPAAQTHALDDLARPHPACLDGAKDGVLETKASNIDQTPSAQGGWGLTELRAAALADHLSLHRHEVDGGDLRRRAQ